jgi:hypothetical protein
LGVVDYAVAGTIDLDNELGRGTIEIRRVALERVLPSKFQSIRSSAQGLPEIGLR